MISLLSLRKLSSDATLVDEREKSDIETGDVQRSVERETEGEFFELRILSLYPMGDDLSDNGLIEPLEEELDALENIGEAIKVQSPWSVRFVETDVGVFSFVEVIGVDCFEWRMGVLIRISVEVGVQVSSSLGDDGLSSEREIDQEDESSSVDPRTVALF